MSMRIWHQSFTVLSELGAYNDALQRHFKKVARPDTEIVMHGMHPGTYTSNYPGHDIKYASLQYLHGLQFMAAAVQAERGGADAFALSTLPEPALREIRGLVDIPVVGYGESAMLTACMLGRKFGVLVFIDELADLVADNVARHGLRERFAAVKHVGFRFNDVLAAFDNPGPLIDTFRAAARGLIALGADVIVPGEAPLNVLLARNGISEVDGVPVLDSLAAWIKHAESLVDMRRLCGTRPCRNGYFGAHPPGARIDEIFAFYGLSERMRHDPASGGTASGGTASTQLETDGF
ncbi:MAG: aspartate/glutamate racemase family protein [Pseudomonadota bacterium]